MTKPKPEVWEFEDSDTVLYMYSYHHLREYLLYCEINRQMQEGFKRPDRSPVSIPFLKVT